MKKEANTSPTEKFVIKLPLHIATKLKDLAQQNTISVNDLIRVSILKTARQSKFYELADALRFGKYTNELVETVIRADPSYVVWLCRNIEGFHLSDDAEGLLIEIAHLNKLDLPENLYAWEN